MPLWTPHEYQKKAVKFVIERGSSQLWLDPGLGKTSIMLQVIRALRMSRSIRRTLVVAPLRPAYGVWPEEVKKWDNFQDITVSVLHGPGKDKRFHDDAMIHVINFEGLSWLSNAYRKKGGEWPYDLLIVDEISFLKNPRTQRYKTLVGMLDNFKRRIGLTGSPAPNSLLDIFGPQYIIDRGATFGKYITHFRNAYFYPTGFGGYEWKLQPGAEEKIHFALSNKVLRMNAEDYLTMPELITNRVYVELPDAARKLYKEFEDQLFADLGSGEISAVNAAVAVGKCQQIANGAIYLDGLEREVRHVHDEKIKALEEVIEELNGKPCLVGYHFQHDLFRLKQAYPNAPVIGSGVTGQELTDITNKWNNGETPVLLAHPQSAGHGLNLQGAGHAVIWFSNTWSFEVFDQFIRRLWRQGQRNNIVIHQIVAKKTIDEAIIKALERKDSTQKSLMNAVQEYANQQKEQ